MENMSEQVSEHSPKPVKAPLGGIVIGIVLLLGFAAWTGTRILSANQARLVVETKRQEDSARTQAALNAPVRVSVIQATQASWVPKVEFDGTLAAAQSAGLGFKLGGRISAVRVQVGDWVKAGAVLGSLDTTEAAAQLRASEAQIRAAQAQLLMAQDEERRTTQLVSSGSVPEAVGVQTTQRAALAQAQLDSAAAQVALVRVNLSQHSVVAPFAGTVTRVPDGIGAVISPGAVQFELVDTRSLRLKTTVSEQDADLLKAGAEVELEGAQTRGRIAAVLSSVDPNTRRVPVEATVPNEEQTLRAGTFVRARVQSGAPVSVWKLPHTVLRPGSQDEVLAVEGPALVSRRVVYALDTDGSLLVRSGLRGGEQIVVSPTPEAKAGDPVSVEPRP
ncbi:MAG: hypothetical protein RJA70_2605 [Pseudomonadota bacterium]|jgi:membrane fusion protein (multidrug efflux system)